MINFENQLLILCLEDSLFAALYPALKHLAEEWQTASPVILWTHALEAKGQLASSHRPDLLLPHLFAQSPLPDGLISQSLILWMLFAEEPNLGSSPLKNSLCTELWKHKERWLTIYERFRESEAENETKGYQIEPHHFASPLPDIVGENTQRSANDLRNFILEAIHSESIDDCRAIYMVLTRFDRTKGHIYDEEEKLLTEKMDEWTRRQYEAKRVENYFEKDSCTVHGDLVGSKEVQYEVSHIGRGGIGVNIGNKN